MFTRPPDGFDAMASGPIPEGISQSLGVWPSSQPGPTTLPKTNIAPENRPLEKEIPIGNHHL